MHAVHKQHQLLRKCTQTHGFQAKIMLLHTEVDGPMFMTTVVICCLTTQQFYQHTSEDGVPLRLQSCFASHVCVQHKAQLQPYCCSPLICTCCSLIILTCFRKISGPSTKSRYSMLCMRHWQLQSSPGTNSYTLTAQPP